MIGSYSIINAIAYPKSSDHDEDSRICTYVLYYAGASDYKYKLDNYEVVSFYGDSSNICISYAWDYENQKYVNAFALRHGRKMLDNYVNSYMYSPLDHSEGKLIIIGEKKYLDVKYKFTTGDVVNCIQDIKNNDSPYELGTPYIKDITVNGFYIDPKTIYCFITFVSELCDEIISYGEDNVSKYYINNPKEYNLEEYYKNKLDDKFKDLESLLNSIKDKYHLYVVRAIKNGRIFMCIDYKSALKPSTLICIDVINQNGNIYMVSNVPEYHSIYVFYNVLNNTVKVVAYDPPLEYVEECVLCDKGIIGTYLTSNGERLILDPNTLELVPIDLKYTIYSPFSYEKEFDMSICLEENNDILGTFGLIYEEILIPNYLALYYDYDYGLFPMHDEFVYIYTGSARIPVNCEGKYEEYDLFKLYKYSSLLKVPKKFMD